MNEPPANGNQCEACGLVSRSEDMAKIRTTNGMLRLCCQCLSDINRKNPEVARLRAENERLQWAMEAIYKAAKAKDARIAAKDAALEKIAPMDNESGLIARAALGGEWVCAGLLWHCPAREARKA